MDDLDFLRPKLPDHIARLVREAKEVAFQPCKDIAATVEKTGRCTARQAAAMRGCLEQNYLRNPCDFDDDDPLLYDTWMFS